MTGRPASRLSVQRFLLLLVLSIRLFRLFTRILRFLIRFLFFPLPVRCVPSRPIEALRERLQTDWI